MIRLERTRRTVTTSHEAVTGVAISATSLAALALIGAAITSPATAAIVLSTVIVADVAVVVVAALMLRNLRHHKATREAADKAAIAATYRRPMQVVHRADVELTPGVRHQLSGLRALTEATRANQRWADCQISEDDS
ncbi:MAG: hypothetical protein RJA49_1667 [Actinomycetota bacterium]|jgi:predicted lysophospholipase L1 biosynthesis ABC-type transport system permease subunit